MNNVAQQSEVGGIKMPLNEVARLDAHFIHVLRTMHTYPPPGLGRAQRRARDRHLERLDAYRRRKQFPKNRRFPGKFVPHFIDDAGTRCALGHLIELGGGRDLVQAVARERNYARVRELCDLPQLTQWLEANGLTLAEAAMIQPSYCGSPADNCVCRNGISRGFVEGTLGDGGATLTVTAVYGYQNVSVGDQLSVLDPNDIGAMSDVVFASLTGTGAAGVEFAAIDGQVTIPLSACLFPQTAIIPGPLPLAVVEQALSAGSEEACEAVLVAYNEAWGSEQGGLECTGGGGSGGISAGGGIGGIVTGGTGGALMATGGTGATAGAGGSTGSDASTAGSTSDAGTRDGRAHDDGGCGIASRPTESPVIVIVLSAACLVHQVRRANRRMT